MCGQVCLLFNQIAGFFGHQYLWKASIDILEFLHGHSYQGKVAFGTTTFVWIGPSVCLDQSDCKIF